MHGGPTDFFLTAKEGYNSTAFAHTVALGGVSLLVFALSDSLSRDTSLKRSNGKKKPKRSPSQRMRVQRTNKVIFDSCFSHLSLCLLPFMLLHLTPWFPFPSRRPSRAQHPTPQANTLSIFGPRLPSRRPSEAAAAAATRMLPVPLHPESKWQPGSHLSFFPPPQAPFLPSNPPLTSPHRQT